MHFKKFETEKIDECLDFIAELVEDAKHIDKRNEQVVKATGGGAYLFQDKIAKRLPGITIQKEDEMECLINGTYLPARCVEQSGKGVWEI